MSEIDVLLAEWVRLMIISGSGEKKVMVFDFKKEYKLMLVIGIVENTFKILNTEAELALIK